jgi:hypothetical protein
MRLISGEAGKSVMLPLSQEEDKGTADSLVSETGDNGTVES